jgi:hypothetical protein
MGPGPQASHQKGASHEKKISFTFKLCGGGKKSEGNQGKDNGDRRMKKSEVNEKKFSMTFFCSSISVGPRPPTILNPALTALCLVH